MELIVEKKESVELDKVEYVIDYSPDTLGADFGTDTDVTINGNGDVDIQLLFELDGYTYDQYLYLNIDMLEDLLKTVNEHKRDWDRYKKNIPEFQVDTKVKVSTGRNAGKCGTITSIKSDAVMVDFGGEVIVENTRHQDAYWVNFENVVLL